MTARANVVPDRRPVPRPDAGVVAAGLGTIAALRYKEPMPSTVATYLEVGRHRVFAGALGWPGWCRGGRDEAAAMEALVAYGPRYAAALGGAAAGLAVPRDVAALDVVERVQGNATTDFGAPGVPPPSDARPIGDEELARFVGLLEAAWSAFDAAVVAAAGVELRKGPRGGGREIEAMVAHVRDADRGYLGPLGGTASAANSLPDPAAEMRRVRDAFVDALGARARGEPLPPNRRSKTVWTPRYAVRRSAWHALDHAWEIEDRRLPVVR